MTLSIHEIITDAVTAIWPEYCALQDFIDHDAAPDSFEIRYRCMEFWKICARCTDASDLHAQLMADVDDISDLAEPVVNPWNLARVLGTIHDKAVRRQIAALHGTLLGYPLE